MVNRTHNPALNGEQEAKIGLISYLAKIGLADNDLAQVISLLQNSQHSQQENIAKAAPPEQRSIQPAQPNLPEPLATSRAKITIYLAEEQQILREAYQAFFSAHRDIQIVGASDDTSAESIVAAVRHFEPNVLLLGVKSVQQSTVERLATLRESCPDVGLVLLFAFYDAHGMKALREFSRDASAGCAYLLKHTVDTVDQLAQMVSAVAEGRIIVDPVVMEGLIKNPDPQSSFLSELSPRELEVLSWMAKGYRNDTIAGILSRDVKTVERHINNIYSKLQNNQLDDDDEMQPGSLHPRVRAALSYLKATGLLPTNDLDE